MIINEKGLCRAMARAFKREGYTVIRAGEQVMLYGGTWYVRTDWNNLPAKAKALMVEQSTLLPEAGDALQIGKAEGVQTMVEDITAEDIKSWEREEGAGEQEARRVPVLFEQVQLFQCGTAEVRCFGARPEDLEIAMDWSDKPGTLIAENRLSWWDAMEYVSVTAWRPGEYGRPKLKKAWEALESVDLRNIQE